MHFSLNKNLSQVEFFLQVYPDQAIIEIVGAGSVHFIAELQGELALAIDAFEPEQYPTEGLHLKKLQ